MHVAEKCLSGKAVEEGDAIVTRVRVATGLVIGLGFILEERNCLGLTSLILSSTSFVIPIACAIEYGWRIANSLQISSNKPDIKQFKSILVDSPFTHLQSFSKTTW